MFMMVKMKVIVEHYITQLFNIKRKQQKGHQNVEGNLKKLHQGNIGEGRREAELRKDVQSRL
jgi:hypothetical protein